MGGSRSKQSASVQQDQPSTSQEEPLRVVLLGKTGAGKSSFGNTLTGETEFEVHHLSASGTSTCKTATRGSGEITVIDTPGFFDNRMDEKKIKPEILKCMIECSPGPHAFLLLLKVDRYTEQEVQVIKKIEEYFSEAYKYAVLVFTHGDQLPEDKTIKDFIKDNKALQKLSDKCGGRCHVIDNKYWKNNQDHPYRNNQVQVRELIKTIKEMVKKNRGTCYTNPIFQKIDKELKEETDRTGSIEQAKTNVFESWWEILSDIDIETLLGAFFGILAMVGLVMTKFMD